eukprot:g7879.t1
MMRNALVLLFTVALAEIIVPQPTPAATDGSSVMHFDCTVTFWSSWAPCSTTCRIGETHRRRTMQHPALCPKWAWPKLRETKYCNAGPCHFFCQLSRWGAWSKCTQPCDAGGVATPAAAGGGGGGAGAVAVAVSGGAPRARVGGTQARTRVVLAINGAVARERTQEEHAGVQVGAGAVAAGERAHKARKAKLAALAAKICPPLWQRRRCNTTPCAIDCTLAAWGVWRRARAAVPAAARHAGGCAGGCCEERARRVLVPPAFGGQPCAALQQARPCAGPGQGTSPSTGLGGTHGQRRQRQQRQHWQHQAATQGAADVVELSLGAVAGATAYGAALLLAEHRQTHGGAGGAEEARPPPPPPPLPLRSPRSPRSPLSPPPSGGGGGGVPCAPGMSPPCGGDARCRGRGLGSPPPGGAASLWREEREPCDCCEDFDRGWLAPGRNARPKRLGLASSANKLAPGGGEQGAPEEKKGFLGGMFGGSTSGAADLEAGGPAGGGGGSSWFGGRTEGETGGEAAGEGENSGFFSSMRAMASASTEDEGMLTMSATQRFQWFVALMMTSFLFMGLAFTFLPLVVLRPAKFGFAFTMGSILFMGAFAMLKGPKAYCKSQFKPEALPRTLSYWGSMGLTLYACVVKQSYLGVIASSSLMVGVMLWFTAATVPGGTTGLKACAYMFMRTARMLVKGFMKLFEK